MNEAAGFQVAEVGKEVDDLGQPSWMGKEIDNRFGNRFGRHLGSHLGRHLGSHLGSHLGWEVCLLSY